MRLDELLVVLLGPDVAYARRVPGEVPLSALRPIEAQAVARAVEARRLEVAAGREAARAALATLGVEDVAIGRGERGEPLWPEGIAGSITHTKTLCVAAVTRARAGIGIDAEPEGPLGEEIWDLITTDEELAELKHISCNDAGERARWIFCAKEAAYKCQYLTTGLLLDFGDLQIRWTTTKGNIHAFEASYQRDAPPFGRGDRIPGLIGRAEGHVVAVATLDASRGARS